jgi:hypothetical protein
VGLRRSLYFLRLFSVNSWTKITHMFGRILSKLIRPFYYMEITRSCIFLLNLDTQFLRKVLIWAQFSIYVGSHR